MVSNENLRRTMGKGGTNRYKRIDHCLHEFILRHLSLFKLYLTNSNFFWYNLHKFYRNVKICFSWDGVWTKVLNWLMSNTSVEVNLKGFVFIFRADWFCSLVREKFWSLKTSYNDIREWKEILFKLFCHHLNLLNL